jgi:hypothetical protein
MGLRYWWSLDFVSPLNLTPWHNLYVLVIIEHFSKWLELVPLLDPNNEGIAYAFLTKFSLNLVLQPTRYKLQWGIPIVVWEGIERSLNDFTRPFWSKQVSQMDDINNEWGLHKYSLQRAIFKIRTYSYHCKLRQSGVNYFKWNEKT